MEEGSNGSVDFTGVPVSIIRIALRTHLPKNAHSRNALSANRVCPGYGYRSGTKGGQETLYTFVALGFGGLA